MIQKNTMSILRRLLFSDILFKPEKTPFYLRFHIRNVQTNSKSKLTSYALNKYVSFVKSYEITLKKNFPAAVKFIKVFTEGLKYFKNDVMILFRAFKKVNSDGLHSLTRKELEIYYEMPWDILRTAPVMFTAGVLPLGSTIFIIAYHFPRHMLTHHFWSIEQKSQFSLVVHKKKLESCKPILRCMEKSLKSPLKQTTVLTSMNYLLESLGNGIHPKLELILECKPLFEQYPFGLSHLSVNHLAGLLKLHGLHRGWKMQKRLHDRANFIHLMDLALLREGGIESLNEDEIKWHCFFRGLNPINMISSDIQNWLKTWLTVSQEINTDSYSLLLHCPLLLAYNQPTNWQLLHKKK